MKGRLSECIAIGVPNISAAADFYRQVMGFDLVEETDGWVELRAGAIRLFLCEDSFGAPTYEFITPDVDEAVQTMLTAGCERLELGTQEVFLRDPFGQVFCVSKGD